LPHLAYQLTDNCDNYTFRGYNISGIYRTVHL